MDGVGSKSKEEHNPIINSTSLALIILTPCTQPLEVMKTRLQLDRHGHYKGIVHCGVSIVKSEGVRALWKGFTPLFTWRTLSAYAFLHATDFNNTPQNLLTTIFMSTPFDVVRMRLQQQNNHHVNVNVKYKGALHCVRTIIREERLRGLWVGFTPALIKHGIFRASIFAAEKFGKKDEIEKENKRIIVGMEASLLVVGGVVCSNPFDVVQTRLMTQGGSGEVNKYKGMVHAFKTIYSEEGFLALWRTLMLRSIIIPSSAFIFLIVNKLI